MMLTVAHHVGQHLLLIALHCSVTSSGKIKHFRKRSRGRVARTEVMSAGSQAWSLGSTCCPAALVSHRELFSISTAGSSALP